MYTSLYPRIEMLILEHPECVHWAKPLNEHRQMVKEIKNQVKFASKVLEYTFSEHNFVSTSNYINRVDLCCPNIPCKQNFRISHQQINFHSWDFILLVCLNNTLGLQLNLLGT